jgi:hypothetical protein
MDDSPISDIEGDDEPLISLNTITGLSSAEMMQLHIQVREATLEAPIDFGSTHSFISATAAR